MAQKKTDFSIEEKLSGLLTLQKIDSKIDKLNIQKGELPLEVADLQDELQGLETRVKNFDGDIEKIEEYISTRQNDKKEAESLIKKYEKQQENVKNSREFEAINKELEMQNLEIKLCDKNIKDANLELEARKDNRLQTENLLTVKKEIYEQKNAELEKIIAETEKEESALSEKSDNAKEKVDERMLKAYSKIRTNYKNGLAVVPVERDSCGGCYNMIPPQRQAEINQRKKIIICEHCGRILVDDELYEKVNPE